ncbi:MAG: glycerol kinase, partial [Candidatus Bipolaricaulia bacterium]
TGIFESSALGAAYGAGLAVGLWDDLKELKELIRTKKDKKFKPSMTADEREELYGRWKKAVKRAKDWTL